MCLVATVKMLKMLCVLSLALAIPISLVCFVYACINCTAFSCTQDEWCWPNPKHSLFMCMFHNIFFFLFANYFTRKIRCDQISVAIEFINNFHFDNFISTISLPRPFSTKQKHGLPKSAHTKTSFTIWWGIQQKRNNKQTKSTNIETRTEIFVPNREIFLVCFFFLNSKICATLSLRCCLVAPFVSCLVFVMCLKMVLRWFLVFRFSRFFRSFRHTLALCLSLEFFLSSALFLLSRFAVRRSTFFFLSFFGNTHKKCWDSETGARTTQRIRFAVCNIY